MMTLRDYYMSLPSAAARAEFAERAGTTWYYVHQLICRSDRSRRNPSPKLAHALHAASGGKVPLSALRPDIWRDNN